MRSCVEVSLGITLNPILPLVVIGWCECSAESPFMCEWDCETLGAFEEGRKALCVYKPFTVYIRGVQHFCKGGQI